jgi:hypothetical protein
VDAERGSGLDGGQTPIRAATVFHVREGAVTRLVVYFDREHALADLGFAKGADTRAGQRASRR